MDLQVINVASLLAVVIGGIGMGVYLAYATRCGYTPSLITLIVLGWSFLLPLGLEQSLFEGEITVGRMLERMALWALFAVHARLGVRLFSRYRTCGKLRSA